MRNGSKLTYPAPETGRRNWSKPRCINWKLLPLKVLLFLMFGGMTALYPFMTIHMKSIGLTLTEIGLIYALLPFVSCIGPPVGGAIADRIGNYRIVFVGIVVYTVITHMLLWFAVPSAAPRRIYTDYNLTSIPIFFPCVGFGNTSVAEIVLPLDQTCAANSVPKISFDECSSDCFAATKPEICTHGLQNQTNCDYYGDFDHRYLSGGSIHFSANSSLTLRNFTAHTGEGVSSIGCRLNSSRNSECAVSCRAHGVLRLTCAKTVPSENRVRTIVLYALFRFLAGIGMSTFSPMLDAIAYQMSKEHHGDLGFQRMFTLLGMCIAPPLSGFLVGMASKSSGYEDFSPAFYIFGGCLTIGGCIAYFMALSLKMPAEHIMKYIGQIIRSPKVSVFVFMMFLTGMMWGFLENYLFVFMEEIGSPKWLLGMTGTVSALSALPVVALSTYIMRYLGHTKIVMVCCILYGLRFLCYSFTYDPYMILPVEVLEAFTTSLLWVVASVYVGKVAPNYVATLQGVVMGAHGAIGRGTGSLIGGLMFDSLKPRKTYQIWAAACIVAGLFYAVLHFAWLRRLKHVPEDDSSAFARKSENGALHQDPQIYRLSAVQEEDLEKMAESDALMQSVTGSMRPINYIHPISDLAENEEVVGTD